MYLCLKGPDENQQMLIGLPFLKMWLKKKKKKKKKKKNSQ